MPIEESVWIGWLASRVDGARRQLIMALHSRLCLLALAIKGSANVWKRRASSESKAGGQNERNHVQLRSSAATFCRATIDGYFPRP